MNLGLDRPIQDVFAALDGVQPIGNVFFRREDGTINGCCGLGARALAYYQSNPDRYAKVIENPTVYYYERDAGIDEAVGSAYITGWDDAVMRRGIYTKHLRFPEQRRRRAAYLRGYRDARVMHAKPNF